MINKSFEAYKIKRELKRSGIEYKFLRYDKDEFGEPKEPADLVGTLIGLYHEENSNIQITTGDTSRTRTKKIPMILCLYEDIASFKLKPEDFIVINGKTFKVTGVVNIQEWNVICDISLEVVDDGVHY